MKIDRSVAISNLASNLELMLINNKEKLVAFTSDSDKVDVDSIMADIISMYASKNVAILSYSPIENKMPNVEYILVDALADTKESIDEKLKEIDIAFVLCPNVLKTKNYLHMATYVNNLVVVAKKWSSKTKNILAIKELATAQNINIMGIVYNN